MQRAALVFELNEHPARRVPFPSAQETPAMKAQTTAWLEELALRSECRNNWKENN